MLSTAGWAGGAGRNVGAVGWMKAGGTIYHSVSPLSSQKKKKQHKTVLLLAKEQR